VNILYIMTDDHTAQMMSCYDTRYASTPNLDRIAVEGVRQQLGESLLRIVKDAGRVVVKTVFVGMLARKHTGAAGTAQGIGDETVGETHALDGDAVEIGRRSVTRSRNSSSFAPYGRRS